MLALCLSCSDDDGNTTTQQDGGGPSPDGALASGPHCNPISTDNCLLPWPSSFYLKKDTATATGWRVNYSSKALPVNHDGTQLTPTRHNLSDGFPVAAQPVVYFARGVAAANLPGMDKIADSITDKSPIWIFNMSTGKKVPFWAELDENGEKEEVKPLILRPAQVLAFDTRHAIVVRTSLKDASGGAHTAPAPFKQVLDGGSITDPTLKAEAARLAPVITFLTGKGIKKADMVLAWDFHTASKAFVRGNLINMVKEARAKLPSSGPKFTITKAEDTTSDTNMMRYVLGKMTVPSFLVSDAGDAMLKLDAKGKPVYRGDQQFEFRINIPRCAAKATKPLPILYYGLGLFSWPETDMDASFDRLFPNKLCMITASTAWIGLSEKDLPYVITKIVTEDFSNLPIITDRLQQAHVNFHALVKLMQGDLLKDKSMLVNGKPIADGKERYYVGISNGGIQGVAFAALEPDISRFVFNVSGGFWSLMIQRSSNFVALGIMLEARYPKMLDRAILVSTSQHLWDLTDPASFASMLVTEPLTGHPKKLIMYQESIEDDQVPTISTRSVARSMGIPQLTPNVAPIFGLTQKAGPLDSAFMQWDLKLPYRTTKNNTPSPKPKESKDSPHLMLREKDTCINSWKKFFTATGKVENPCKGACDPD